MKKLTVILMLLVALTAKADLLSDILAGVYSAQRMAPTTPLVDGERFAQMVGGSVFAYSYKTGSVTDTLFDKTAATGVKIGEIEGYVLAPNADSRYMLVYTNSQRIFRRSFTAEYYIYDRKKHVLTALSDTMPVMQPVFSPDGRYVAFSRGCNLYIHKLDFHTEVAVTRDGKEGEIINGTPDWLYEEEFSTTCLYAFSADSKQLAYVRLVEKEVPTFSWQEYLASDGSALRYPALQSLRYPKAGEKNAEASVCVYDTYYKSNKTMQLPQQNDSYIPRLRWNNATEANPTGDLAIFRLNRDQNKLEMFFANPKSTVCTRIYTEECKTFCVNFEHVDNWYFLSDNSFVCLNETSGYTHAYLYSATGSKLKQLTRGDFDVTALYGYDEASQTLYYQAADKDPMTRYVYALNVKKNVTKALTPKEGTHRATFSATLSYFVDDYQSVSSPNRYTLYDAAGKKVRELKNNDDVQARCDEIALPKKEFFSFTTPIGTKLYGWMLKPLNFDSNKQYPILQYHYDGPSSQSVLNTWKIGWEEYMAKEKGYVVVCVDARGTDARGRAFREETYMNLGVKEAEDQVYVAQYLQTLPYVDKDRMAIWGWSYGGFSTIMSMSICSINPALNGGVSPFKCGMAVAAVTDWKLYDSAYTERYMRRPQVNEGGYKNQSLPALADKLQGDLLLVHGLADDNVHAQNVLLYIDALVQAGKQFDMQIYPDDNHFLRKRANHEHVYRTLTRYLEQHNR